MKFIKYLRSNRGITGTDIVAAITLIILTMGVVTAIYINVTNKTKENIRYSNATRIATQIIENIQINTFEDLIYRCDNNLNQVSMEENEKIFDVNIPLGYSVLVTATPIDSAKYDIVRDVKVEVSYKISNINKSITLNFLKERELLEQTNPPIFSELSNYGNIKYFYPVKLVTQDGINKYFVTDKNDSEWYNYDIGFFALAVYSVKELELGEEINILTNPVYVWIPRFGIKDDNSVVSSDNFSYVYGTSKYKISLCEIGNGTKKLYCYTINYNDEDKINNTPVSIESYPENSFEEDDGLTGIWYKYNSINELEEYEKKALSIYTIFNNINPCKNLK